MVGNITHSSILVPYHGWRISHRTHHANHGHVENDESWYPTSKSTYDNMVRVAWSSHICPLDRCLECGQPHMLAVRASPGASSLPLMFPRDLSQDALSRLGRVSFPLSLFAYPFYLMSRSPGKVGSHFDPKCDLFTPGEGKLVSYTVLACVSPAGTTRKLACS